MIIRFGYPGKLRDISAEFKKYYVKNFVIKLPASAGNEISKKINVKSVPFTFNDIRKPKQPQRSHRKNSRIAPAATLKSVGQDRLVSSQRSSSGRILVIDTMERKITVEVENNHSQEITLNRAEAKSDLVSLNDKIRWLLVNDRNPLMPDCTDKLLCKDYLARKLHNLCVNSNHSFFPQTYQQASSVTDLLDLIRADKGHPKSYIIKANNASGRVIIVKNDMTLSDISSEQLSGIDRYRLKSYNEVHPGAGWFYGKIQYQCFSEELLQTGNTDYKFHCSAGEPRYCQLVNDITGKRENKSGVNIDLDGNVLHFETNNRLNTVFTLPANWDKMKEVAKILSQDFNYVRVDMYNTDVEFVGYESIYIGELTFAPAGGNYNKVGQIDAGKLLIGIDEHN